MTTAVYPGSFDPIHEGHLDVIKRAQMIFDKVVVGVLDNTAKSCLFTAAERAQMVRESLGPESDVVVAHFSGLAVEFAISQGAAVIVRGLRAVSDLDSEFQMALMNRRLAPEIETVFLQPAGRYSFVSSRMLKEVFSFGGDVTGLVPPNVLKRLRGRMTKS